MRRIYWLTIVVAVIATVGLGFFYLRGNNDSVATLLGQNPFAADADSDRSATPDEVPPEQVAKYIKVYQAMNRNRGLTVEQAAAQQGLSLEDFRAIERRIERDDLLREHVRQELQQSAKTKAPPKTEKP